MPRRWPPRCPAACTPWRCRSLSDAARTLFAFYDLQVSPITFDFLWFLVGADLRAPAPGTRCRACGDRAGVGQAACAASARTTRMSSTPRRGPSASAIFCCRPVRCCRPAPASPMPHRGACRFIRATLASHLYPAGYEAALPVFAGSRDCLAERGRTCPTYPVCARPMRTCATSTVGRRAMRAAAGSSPSRCGTMPTCRLATATCEAWIERSHARLDPTRFHARVRSRPGADAQWPACTHCRASCGAGRARAGTSGCGWRSTSGRSFQSRRQHRPDGPVLAQRPHPLRHAQDGAPGVPQTSPATTSGSLASSPAARCRSPRRRRTGLAGRYPRAVQRAFTRIAERLESKAQCLTAAARRSLDNAPARPNGWHSPAADGLHLP